MKQIAKVDNYTQMKVYNVTLLLNIIIINYHHVLTRPPPHPLPHSLHLLF